MLKSPRLLFLIRLGTPLTEIAYLLGQFRTGPQRTTMNTSATTDRTAPEVPRSMARLAGVFYLLTFATGSLALFAGSRLSSASGMIAGACYVVVTFLFYHLFKPVNRS